jgi:hypothetical protein
VLAAGGPASLLPQVGGAEKAVETIYYKSTWQSADRGVALGGVNRLVFVGLYRLSVSRP